MRLAKTVEPLGFEQVEGRLVGKRDDDGMSLALQNFGFVTADGIRWPKGDLALALKQREGGPVSGGEFSAQRLDIGLMAQIASRVPLGEAVARLLAELKPQGVVSDLATVWQGPLDAPTRYQAKATFNGLSLAAKPSAERDGIGRPGLRNATVQVRASETGGSAQLKLAAGELDFPGVFAESAVPFDTLDAKLDWKIAPAAAAGVLPDVSVQVKDARAERPHRQGCGGPGRPLPSAGHSGRAAPVRRTGRPGRPGQRRDLPRQGRPVGLPLHAREDAEGGRVPHRRQDRRRRARLRAGGSPGRGIPRVSPRRGPASRTCPANW